MAYIGQGIKNGTFAKLDTSGNTYNGSNVTFDLGTQVGSPVQLLVSHDGVIQNPGTDYTLASNGTQITFTTAPASGASIFIMEISGAVGGPMNRDLNGEELILDVDGDTSITADTDDQIDIKIAGDDDFTFTASTLTVNSTNKICFNDATQFIQGASGTVLDIAATDEIELTSTLVDLNGNLDVSGTTLLPTLGVITAKDLGAGIHIRKADSGASVLADAQELVIESDADTGLSILQHTGGNGTIAFGDSGDNNIGMLQYFHGSVNAMAFTTNASEACRINSNGSFSLGHTTTTSGGGIANASAVGVFLSPSSTPGASTFANNGDSCVTLNRSDPNNNNLNIIGFHRNGGQCGTVMATNNTTQYNTSSDYRLKENVDYSWDATTRLKQLKPARFNWISDETNTLVDGFLAHEVSGVIPEATSGTKDETETKQKVVLNSNGNLVADNIEEEDWTQGKTDSVYANDTTWEASKVFPIYQGIDQSKLVPLLVKTVQELETRIKALEDA